MDIKRLKDAEIVGTKAGKSVVRVYTEEHGWQYEKVSDDQSLDAFAAKVKRKVAK